VERSRFELELFEFILFILLKLDDDIEEVDVEFGREADLNADEGDGCDSCLSPRIFPLTSVIADKAGDDCSD